MAGVAVAVAEYVGGTETLLDAKLVLHVPPFDAFAVIRSLFDNVRPVTDHAPPDTVLVPNDVVPLL